MNSKKKKIKKKGEKKKWIKILREEMEELWKSSDEFISQRMEVEKICETYDVVCIFGPHSHPQLSPIEESWGMGKQSYKKAPGKRSEAKLLSTTIRHIGGEVDLDGHVEKWTNLCNRSNIIHSESLSSYLCSTIDVCLCLLFMLGK